MITAEPEESLSDWGASNGPLYGQRALTMNRTECSGNERKFKCVGGL
ncbi:hypothetical protein I5559_11190 [Acinetobacter oleivorans]|nr:hypothetical protein [Acinetobacter oleivorans]MBJ9420955.1 hypothetical protein [Acinetobacter oleivorans]